MNAIKRVIDGKEVYIDLTENEREMIYIHLRNEYIMDSLSERAKSLGENVSREKLIDMLYSYSSSGYDINLELVAGIVNRICKGEK